MSDCTHDCSTCGQSCRDRGNPDRHEFRVDLNPGSTVKKVIAVVSGKGGVGKSFVTSLLASEMQRRGHNAAVLDADITGPSIPKSFGITGHAMGTDSYLYPAYTKSGIQVMSMNMILEDNSQPAVWRGPVIAGAVKQFWSDVLWTDVDYMFVDMPPGTGDVPLTVFQSLRGQSCKYGKDDGRAHNRCCRKHVISQMPVLRERDRGLRKLKGYGDSKAV